MRSSFLALVGLAAFTAAAVGTISASNSVADTGAGPTFKYLGPLAFAPDDALLAADAQDVSIAALQLGQHGQGAALSVKDVAGIDQKIAAMLGTTAAELTVTDLVVHPKTKNAYISVMRGKGAGARAALLRVDGNGTLKLVPLSELRF